MNLTSDNRQSKHIVVPIESLPHTGHTVRAANIVAYELLRNLNSLPNLRVSLLPIRFQSLSVKRNMVLEEKAHAELSAAGIGILDPVIIDDSESQITKHIRPLMEIIGHENSLIPTMRYSDAASKAVLAAKTDCLLAVWSERLTPMFARVPCRKITYYGNPDPFNRACNLALSESWQPPSKLQWIIRRLMLWQFKRHHFAMMQEWDYLCDIDAKDAHYYSQHGHPNSVYVRNCWIDRIGQQAVYNRPEWHPSQPFKIISSIGRPAATANTHGLIWLVRTLLPQLRSVFADQSFELHILGSGAPNPNIKSLLQEPEIIMRGFVDDIDSEIQNNPIFLCVNNATPYSVGHTRYLHAWSLGAAVVAHQNVKLSMPEFIHEQNALLGSDGADIARHLKRLSENPALVRQLGNAGYETFAQKFAPEQVARDLGAVITQTLSR